MRPVARTELNEVVRGGEGLVLVDHVARGADRPSTLHAVTCRWVRRTGPTTLLRFALSPREAVLWLAKERGEEGEGWQRCRECGGLPADLDERPLPATGQAIWASDRSPDLAWVMSAEDDQVEIAEFDSPRCEAVGRRTVPFGKTLVFLPESGDRCFVD